MRTSLIAIAAFCLILGLTLPVMQFDRLFLFSETPSVVGLVEGLWTGGDLALAILIAVFSIVFPLVKLVVLATLEVRGGALAPWLAKALPHLSKWSMLDVMLVALAIFAAKTSGLATAVSQPGLWFFTASAVISGILSAWLPSERRG